MDMRPYYRNILLTSLSCLLAHCEGQSSKELQANSPALARDTAERFDFTYYGITKAVSSVDTSSGWSTEAQKLLLTGTIYQEDCKTPASGVLLYYYHTNAEGKYLHNPEEVRSMPPNAQGQTHEYLRGWIKTNRNGQYHIYTSRPGTYPTKDAPAHIHATLKEPSGRDEYFIDDFVFDDDKILNSSYRRKQENRGGSGVLRLVQGNGFQIGERDIYLGQNIADYPSTQGKSDSGRRIGEDVVSFTPYHAWGPDKGTRACPICKYGWYHGILYFVGNNPHWADIRKWLLFFEDESRKRKQYLKVYFIYGNEKDYSKSRRVSELAALGKELQLENVALTFVPSFRDHESEVYLNNISPLSESTFMLYKRARIINTFVNLEPSTENYKMLGEQLDNSINEYFYKAK